MDSQVPFFLELLDVVLFGAREQLPVDPSRVVPRRVPPVIAGRVPLTDPRGLQVACRIEDDSRFSGRNRPSSSRKSSSIVSLSALLSCCAARNSASH